MAARQRRIGPSQSPVVAAVATYMNQQSRATSALKWGAVSSAAMILVLADMYFRVVATVTSINVLIVWWSEVVLLSVLFLCVLYDLTLYLGVTLRNSSIRLTAAQRKLLGVNSQAHGFTTVSSPVPFGSPAMSPNSVPRSQASSPTTTPSYYYRTPTGSHHTTPQSHSFSGSFTHTPARSSPASHSTSSPYTGSADRIKDHSSLEMYLREEEDREQRLLRGSPDLSPHSHGGWFGSAHQYSNGSPALRKYQVATRSHSPGEDETGKDSNSVWNKLGIKRNELAEWTENCRKWLAQSILTPVSKEIKQINQTLNKIGCSDVNIGVATLARLREVARVRAQQVPSLTLLTRYLEVTPKQDYLVQRVHDLAKGGCLTAFHWNSGGTWKGRGWDKDLPTDSQIVVHFLCTYMDSLMPPSPQYPDGKTFTNQFFVKCPDSASTTSIALYQSSSSPPHFKILLKESSIEIPRGRSNLFHAIVAFLHHIKTKEKGLLGQLDLKLSGINIMSIIG